IPVIPFHPSICLTFSSGSTGRTAPAAGIGAAMDWAWPLPGPSPEGTAERSPLKATASEGPYSPPPFLSKAAACVDFSANGAGIERKNKICAVQVHGAGQYSAYLLF